MVDDLYYLSHNLDVLAAGIDPAVHYAQYGFREGRNPDAWFDTKGYLEAYPDVAAAGINPVDHYLLFGWKEGRDPSTGFDTTAYLAANPDVVAAGLNPLSHFLEYGRTEGRTPRGDGAFDHSTAAQGSAPALAAASGHLGPVDSPVVGSTLLATGTNHLNDVYAFVSGGSPLVDDLYYFSHNLDVLAAALDPTAHYIEYGAREGRNPNAWFDTTGYLTAYPDVAAAGINPVDHYLLFGAEEGRDPSAGFDTTAYLSANPDVAVAGINPLVHFLEFGRAEGRSPLGDGSFEHGQSG
ncbi:hypothetical protein [Methylobacterium crusticola]|uniref:hypothetical protein n=1 Tax=Methylobacterium crusticola TaxID=1697972 RepID=UPI000FFB3244|nr:hypothetical protein [Methylobacterium crusticola]